MIRRFLVPPALAAAGLLLLVAVIGGCGSDESAQGNVASPSSRAAIRQYRGYLEKNTADLIARVGLMAQQIETGELAEAQSTYSAARVPYGHIKPVTRSFGDLDERIDALPGEVPASKLEGFHQIEKGLFDDESVAGMSPVARQLLANLQGFRSKLKTMKLSSAELVRSATDSLAELSASAIHNKEERYSLIDMVDVSAGVEGAQAAFVSATPPIAEADSDLAAGIDHEFAQTFGRLRHFGIPAHFPDQRQPQAPGTTFVLYSVRSPHEFQVMDEQLKALAARLSEAPELLGEA